MRRVAKRETGGTVDAFTRRPHTGRHMQFFTCRALIALGTAIAGASCAGYQHPDTAAGTLGASVYFKNESLDQVAVYATTSAGFSRTRIGTVMAGRVDTLAIPQTMVGAVGGVYIFARTLGGELTSD